MSLKRSIFFGSLLWVLIFFEVSILMFGFGLPDGLSFNIWHYPLVGLIALFVAIFYFKGNVKKGFSQGLLTGIVFVVTGAILDAIITVPLFVKNYSFFIDPFVLWGVLEGFVITVIIGSIKK